MHAEKTVEEREIKLSDIMLAKGLWPFIRPYFWMLGISVFMVFIVTFLDLLVPLFTQKAIDGFILPATTSGAVTFLNVNMTFPVFVLVFAAVIGISFLIDFAQSLFMEYTGQKIILGLRCRLFDHMAYLPVAYYDRNTSGRLVSRVAGDVENMNEMFTTILVFVFKDLVLMAGIMAVMLSKSFYLSLWIFSVVPVMLVSIFFFSRVSRKAFRTLRQKISEIYHSFSEAVTGIKVIQTTGGTPTFLHRFRKLNHDYYMAGMFQIRIFAVFMPFIGFLSVFCVGIIIYAGGRGVAQGEITIGLLVAFLSYMKMFFRPVRDLSEKFNLLQNALASAERIISVLDNPPFKDRVSDKKTRLDSIDSIEFGDVSFAYNEGEPVLKNISFRIEKGRSIGIIGHTGSGKSSVINLITGFYRQSAGRILINGSGMESFSLKEIRDRTALVMQDPVLFSGTVRENIMPPAHALTEEMLENALYQANCGFLFHRYAGLDTMISEGGRPLSSGEKQLVCIARAFAVDPDIIIFDEATSYMDAQSEQQVHLAMNRLMKGRVSIIIAHRLSTVRACDHIILLRSGRVKETGTHDALVAAEGEYFHLLNREKNG